jgi:uncharacterized protein (TIGR02145 family)
MNNSVFNSKVIFFLLSFSFIIFDSFGFSQSKDEKIQKLNLLVDSLNKLSKEERSQQEKDIKDLTEQIKINQLYLDSISQLSNSSKKKELELSKKIELLDKLNNKTKQIGTQTWMNTNLNTEVFQNGDSITQVKNNIEWVNAFNSRKPAWCYYNNDPKNELKYGKLYNWYAVIDPRNTCPNGWRIPSILDIERMLFKGMEEFEITMIKDQGVCPSCSFTDLEVKYSGLRDVDGNFEGLENYFKFRGDEYLRGSVNWWLMSNGNPAFVQRWDDGNTVFSRWDIMQKSAVGYSIRCIKD